MALLELWIYHPKGEFIEARRGLGRLTSGGSREGTVGSPGDFAVLGTYFCGFCGSNLRGTDPWPSLLSYIRVGHFPY